MDFEALAELLHDVVDMDKPTWQEKKEALIDGLGDAGKADLEEIIGWFE